MSSKKGGAIKQSKPQGEKTEQITAKSTTSKDAQLDSKIEIVKSVTNWPSEDIKRVLEETNGDAQLAIQNILDGKFGISPKFIYVLSQVLLKNQVRRNGNL
jgi:hypothetical protein